MKSLISLVLISLVCFGSDDQNKLSSISSSTDSLFEALVDLKPINDHETIKNNLYGLVWKIIDTRSNERVFLNLSKIVSLFKNYEYSKGEAIEIWKEFADSHGIEDKKVSEIIELLHINLK